MRHYSTKVLERIGNGNGQWAYARIGIFADADDPIPGGRQIGEYTRNYQAFYRTFFPFQLNGKDYALYSPHYTGTRVMELPSCTDICGDEPQALGFCPVEYYVPWYYELTYPELRKPMRLYEELTGNEHALSVSEKQFHPYGFVAGCVWGDDSSRKIQFIDLSRIGEGIFLRDERFGYIELPDGMDLADAIDADRRHPYVQIALTKTFNIETGLEENG